MKEADIQKAIINTLNKRNCKAWRANAGNIRKGNRTIKLLPKGFPDVFGVRFSDGKFFGIEIKKPKGRVSEEQIEFREWAEAHNIIHGIAYSVEDAIQIIEGDKP